jgi:uncharacterized membrane protein
MEALIILILILLAVIIPVRILKPTFILLAALATIISSVTLPYITNISDTGITYAALDPLFQWAIGLALLGTAIILYLEQIDAKKKGEENESN